MDDAFGDALVIEVKDLFAQNEIFEKRRPKPPGLQAVLVVGDRNSVVRGQARAAVPFCLV